MGLQDEILSRMGQITDGEKKTIGEFLQKTYAQNPTQQVNLEARAVKSARCVNEGTYSVIAIASNKIESAKDWLVEEGFKVLTGHTAKGVFWGYRVFLHDNYISL